MKSRHKVVPAVYLIAFKGEKILLGLHQNTGYCDGMLGLPSGHVEEDESPIQALLREVEEEVGIVVKPHEVTMALAMARKSQDRECVDYFFVCNLSEYPIKNCEPEKCQFWKFYYSKELPGHLIPYLKVAIAAVDRSQTYVEYGWKEGEI